MKSLRLMVLAALIFSVLSGCGGGDTKPNPDLKVPDVPEAGHGSKDQNKLDKKKK